MQKLSTVFVVGLLFLSGCNSVPTPLALAVTTERATPVRTLTPSPVPTDIPTLIPSLHVSDWSLVRLNAMTTLSEADGTTSIWAVGDDGFISHISQQGSIKRIDSPTRENLYSIDFISPDDGWIVGANALILHWNGSDWKVAKPAHEARWPYSYDLYKIKFKEANDGWAVGCTGSEGGQHFLIYHWDGTSWTEVSLSDEGTLWVCAGDIVAFSSTDVWIVGAGWNEGKEYGFTIHWDGGSWEIISELNSYKIGSLSALASDDIWAITGNGIVLHWNGAEWKEESQLEAANLILARGADDVFAVGTRIWHWDGSDWNDLSSSSNFPADTEIKTILTPYNAESGEPVIWLLDASGQIYSFSLPATR